jgi:hypothetical protein
MSERRDFRKSRWEALNIEGSGKGRFSAAKKAPVLDREWVALFGHITFENPTGTSFGVSTQVEVFPPEFPKHESDD